MNPLAWMCIALGVMLFIQTIRQWRGARELEETRKTSSRLIADLHRRDQVQAYHELEKGMDEQQESFEQEYLTWNEKEHSYFLQIEAKDALIEELDADNAEYRRMLGMEETPTE